ncbi:hypothetical protein, partial [Mycolicibacterium smegmatis]
IIGRPRPLSRHRRADDLYTLNCEEPVWAQGRVELNYQAGQGNSAKPRNHPTIVARLDIQHS